MGYHTLTFESDDKIATIALTVPEKRNAISTQMIVDLLGAFDQAETSAARVVILTGAGRLSARGWISPSCSTSLANAAEKPRRCAPDDETALPALQLSETADCGGERPAIAGGCGLATVADFVLAVPEAKFGYTEVRIGFTPALVSVFLRRRIGRHTCASCC